MAKTFFKTLYIRNNDKITIKYKLVVETFPVLIFYLLKIKVLRYYYIVSLLTQTNDITVYECHNLTRVTTLTTGSPPAVVRKTTEDEIVVGEE